MARRVVVVGAGVVGLGCAAYLQRMGNEVTIIDRVEPGMSTSYGNGGGIANTFVLPAYLLWDAYLSYTPVEWLTASVYGRNLLDADYFPAVFNGVSRGSGFAGKVRTFGLSLRARL